MARIKVTHRSFLLISVFLLLLAVIFPMSAHAGINEWTAIGPELAGYDFARLVYTLAIDPSNPNILYAGTYSGLFKTTNAGASWANILNWGPVMGLAIDPSNPNILYAATCYGSCIFKSTNAGATWTDVSPYNVTGAGAFAINPLNPNILYAGTYYRVFKTTVAGASWTDVSTGLPWAPNVMALTIDPLNPNTLYAVAGSGFFKTTNSGVSWTADPGLDYYGVSCLAIDPLTPNTHYAGTYHGGVLKSTDGGANWNAMNTGLPDTPDVSVLAIDPLNPNTLYANAYGYVGTNYYGGVFKSTDGGANWNAMNTGLPDTTYVSGLAIDPLNPNILYAGTYGAGVFKYQIQEGPPPPESELWVKVSNTPYGIWSLRQTPGTENKPADDILKIAPNDWVLKIISKTDENGRVVNRDGYIWWKVENPGNGVVGWMGAQKSVGNEKFLIPCEPGNAEVITARNTRVDEILMVLDHYYNNIDNHSSDYSTTSLLKSNDWGYNINNPLSFRTANNISYLKNEGFPIELILGIIATESGDYEFDNEIYDQYYAIHKNDLVTAGVGIMQIHGSEEKLGWDNKSWGTNLKCYSGICKQAFSENGRYKHKFYTNTRQGIYANIKDGLRVLQWAYQESRKKNSTAEDIIQWIGAAWRYNHGPAPQEGITIKDMYLASVANRVDPDSDKKIESGTYFNDYRNELNSFHQYQFLSTEKRKELANKMIKYITGEILSPAELRIYDSQGRITGLVNGEGKNEIPNSDYYEEQFLILTPTDFYDYQVVGTEEGKYGLRITSVEGEEGITFTGIDIPILPQQIHQYTIDWNVISMGGEGIILQIDANGDGIFEKTVTAGSNLTRDQFILQTETTINFDPDTLNLRSKGQFVTVYIKLPTGFDVSQIDISSIRLNSSIPALSKPVIIGDFDSNGIPELMVKFERSKVQRILNPGERVPISVTGKVFHNASYLTFKGNDTIKVVN